MKSRKTNKIKLLFRFFHSLKLTVFLMIALATASIFGTLIPQNAAPEAYLERYGEALGRFLVTFRLFDMYHSWWFYLLISLLALNIIACSIRGFRRDWRSVMAPVTILDEVPRESLACVLSWPDTTGPKMVEEAAVGLLSGEFAVPMRTAVNGDTHLFARRHPAGRLGVHVVHMSIIIILLGVAIGALSGFSKAIVEIEEKGSATTAYNRAGEPVPFGFTVLCEGFAVSYYESGIPKEYKSLLTIVDDGKRVVEKRPVVVNDPLTYRGMTFYQSGYEAVSFLFLVRDRQTGAPRPLTVRAGEKALLPGGGQMVVMDSVDEIRMHSPRYSGPAVHVAVLPPDGAPDSFVLMKNHPDVNADKGGRLQFSYGGVSSWKTVLQVTRDPGVPFVWAGCLLLMAGFVMTFLLSYRCIWIKIGSGEVVMAGSCTGNREAFRVFFTELAERLKAASIIQGDVPKTDQ